MQNATQALDQAVQRGGVPGLVAMATDGRDTLFKHASGVRRLGDMAAMTLDSVFWIASMTKAITSVAVMQLVEQGRVGLRQPLGSVVPKLANPQVLEGFDTDGAPRLRPARREVTLHDLLTHTSGYVYETWNPGIGRYLKATGRPGIGSGLVAALEQPLAFDPGERWEYGIGLDWAGRVIEAISGQSLGRYFAEHITGPLGMVDTRFGRPHGDEPGADRLVSLHHREAGGIRAGTIDRPAQPELESGGGGLYSTGPDYLKFLAMLLRGGDGIVSRETVALMARNQVAGLGVERLESSMPAISNAMEFFPGMAKQWGYGFLINTEPGPAGRRAGSLAWGGLPNCYYWLDLEHGVSGLLLSQMLPFEDPGMLDVLDSFERAVYAAVPRRASI